MGHYNERSHGAKLAKSLMKLCNTYMSSATVCHNGYVTVLEMLRRETCIVTSYCELCHIVTSDDVVLVQQIQTSRVWVAVAGWSVMHENYA